MPKNRMYIVARAKKDLSQEQLANIMNVSVSTIRNWEKKRNVPSLKQVIRLSNVLELSIEEIVLYYK